MTGTGDFTWGHLARTETFGRASEPGDYKQIKKEDLSSVKSLNCRHASHCMLFAHNAAETFNVYKSRAAILMQMRFDGYLGFPGGLVDPGEDLVSALNREMVEELNLDLSRHSVTPENHVVSHLNTKNRLCLHFYAMEVSLPELIEIERNALNAKDFGSEVLGNTRIPLYTMGDGYRGFPTFLKNSFIGNARQQLIHCLLHFGIFSQAEIDKAEAATPMS